MSNREQSLDSQVAGRQGESTSFIDKLLRYADAQGIKFEKPAADIARVEEGAVIGFDTNGEAEAYWDLSQWRLKPDIAMAYQEEQGAATAAGIGHALLGPAFKNYDDMERWLRASLERVA